MPITWKVDKAKLDPHFAGDVEALLRPDPGNWFVTYGFRTREEQAALYAKYLAGGPLAAPPGHSAHEAGLAVDVTLVKGGHDDWNYTDSDWRRLVNAVHMAPRLHSLDDHGDTDHIEAVNWRLIASQTAAAHGSAA
jgi:D-alanyl-D-alanine dipeptidase